MERKSLAIFIINDGKAVNSWQSQFMERSENSCRQAIHHIARKPPLGGFHH